MGSRPNATIFFGYEFSNDGAYPWENRDDWEDEDWTLQEAREDWDPRDYYIYKVLGKDPNEMGYEEKKAIWAEVGVEVDQWGVLFDSDQSCYCIYPTGVFLNTDWDDCIEIPIEMFDIHDPKHYETKIAPLNKFVEAMGIDLQGQTAKWRLAASYG